MNLQTLKVYLKESITKHPQHKEEIVDLYSLCVSEIEEGGSEDHECDLCYRDVEELINNPS